MFDTNRAPILHQDKHYPQTDQTELPLELRHPGVGSNSSKTISMPMVCLVQTVLQPCTNTNTTSKWTKMRFHTTHVTYEFHRVRLKLFMTYGTLNANRARIFCRIVSKWTEQISTRPSSPRTTLGASKTICEPMVRLTQTEHLSCIKSSTISKWTVPSFHLSLVT
jgi:hypothetical protein